MRDIFILLLVVPMLLMALRRPQIGVLAWMWISVMNPHRLAFGWMNTFPILDLVAGVTIVGALLNAKNASRASWQPVLTWLLVFYAWCTLTMIFAVSFDHSFEPWLKFTKALLPCIFMMLFMNERHWIISSIFVFTLSIAFFGIKGGLFTIYTGAESLVFGPPNSSWGDNNGVCMAMLIGSPLIMAIRHMYSRKVIRLGLFGSSVLCYLALIGTASRGGLVGLAGQVTFILYRTNRKAISAILLVAIVGVGLVLMPDSWLGRMSSISTDMSELDASAYNRIVQWYYAIDIANERPFFGNGFNAFFFQPYYLEHVAHLDKNRAVHSNYFQILGEQGYIGLFIYLSMWLTFVVTSQRWAKKALQHEDLKWAGYLLQAVQFGFFGHAFNGLTVNMAYLDLPYYLMAISVLLISFVQKELKLKEMVDPQAKNFNGAVMSGVAEDLQRLAR